MKIALVRSSVHRGGGVERYVWLLARELDRRGHEVHLIARRCPELPAPSVRFHPVRARGPFSFTKVLSFARGVRALLARERFDVVHSCDRVFSCDMYRAGEGLHREWLEVSRRHMPPWKAALRWANPLHLLLCRMERRLIAGGGARLVTAISRRGAEEIRRHFGRGVPLIYNGVDPEEFRPPEEGEREEARRRLGVPRESFVALFVGSGFFRKGLRYLIEAFSILEGGTGGTPRLVVAGRGTTGPYERQARALGVRDRVLFCGTGVPTARLYRIADAFVFPTLYEPFGNVCLEALASGLPCILSSRSGGAEIVADGVSGLVLQDPTSPQEIAGLMRRCMDRAVASALGRAARALALRYRVEANAEATEALYRKLIAGRASGEGAVAALSRNP